MTHEEMWLSYYNLLVDYKEKHGNTDVPLRYVTEDGYNLGNWVSRQRSYYKNKKMSQKRIDLLNELSFKWIVRIGKDFTWDDWFKLLVEYKNEYGTCNVPYGYVTKNGYKLGIWVNTQVKAINGYYNISEDHIEQLENLGLSIYRREDNWNNNFEQIEYIINRYGYSKLSYNQRAWLSRQRKMNLEGKLGKIEKNLLENLGINLTGDYTHLYKYYLLNKKNVKEVPDIKDKKEKKKEPFSSSLEKIRNEKWLAKYKKVKEYYLKHGNLDVKITYVTEDGFQMGAWINTQRCAYNKGKLSDDRIKLLKKINFSFGNKKGLWIDNYKIAKEYYLKHGNLDVAQIYVDENGFKLGMWLSSQRVLYKKGRLDEKKIELLKEISFIFDSNKGQFYNKFNLSKEYYKEHGNLDIDFDYVVNNIKLGRWIDNLRYKYLLGTLSKDKIDLLNSIGMVWQVTNNISDSYFNKYYSKFKEVYDNNNGNIELTYKNVDENTKKWVLKNRDDYSKHILSNQKIKLLNDMSFDWNVYDTNVLNGDYDNLEYKKIMLVRMKHILSDLSYEINVSINDREEQEKIEKEIIKRMWR